MDALNPMALAPGAGSEDPVGAYFGDTEGSWDRLSRQGTVGWSLRGVRADTRRSIPLTWDDSPFVPGLRVMSDASDEAPRRVIEGDRPVVVGTVRMGFGHHRIAYAAYTWALAQGGTAPEAPIHDGRCEVCTPIAPIQLKKVRIHHLQTKLLIAKHLVQMLHQVTMEIALRKSLGQGPHP